MLQPNIPTSTLPIFHPYHMTSLHHQGNEHPLVELLNECVHMYQTIFYGYSISRNSLASVLNVYKSLLFILQQTVMSLNVLYVTGLNIAKVPHQLIAKWGNNYLLTLFL